jgi:hypothetical protein
VIFRAVQVLGMIQRNPEVYLIIAPVLVPRVRYRYRFAISKVFEMILLRNGQTALMRRPSNSDACDMDLTAEDFGSRQQSRTQAQPPRTEYWSSGYSRMAQSNHAK